MRRSERTVDFAAASVIGGGPVASEFAHLFARFDADDCRRSAAVGCQMIDAYPTFHSAIEAALENHRRRRLVRLPASTADGIASPRGLRIRQTQVALC